MWHRIGERTAGTGRARRAATWVLALCVLITPLASAVAMPAQAVDEVCFLGLDGEQDCVDYSTPAAPGPNTLLSPQAYQAMTTDQAAALRRLEDRAVAIVRSVHGLPNEDSQYVLAWGRDEATGLLQKMVMKAVNTLPVDRTSDERLVASWMAVRVHESLKRARFQEGEEFARWAGLDVSRYWQLVEDGASKAELTDYLSQTPRALNGATRETSTGGYCAYRPPAPYSDYEPDKLQICHVPCTGSFGCVPQPTFDQFVAWGAARAGVYSKADDARFAVSTGRATGISSGTGLLARMLISLPGTGWTNERYVDLLKELQPGQHVKRLLESAERFGTAEFRAAWTWDGLGEDIARKVDAAWKASFSEQSLTDVEAQLRWAIERATDGYDNATGFGTLTDELRLVLRNAHTGGVPTEDAVLELAARVARLAGKLTQAVGSLADLLVTAMTSLIDGSLIFAANEELPSRIASNVVFARDQLLDPKGISLHPDGQRMLTYEFMDAVGMGGSATPVRQASPSDPHFLVRGLDYGAPTEVPFLRLGRIVDDRWSPVHVRVSGGWVVERWFDTERGLDLLSLELHYTNHDLQSELAWLVPHGDGRYSFLIVSPEKPSFDRDTCIADGTCWESDELRYLDTEGNPKIARLEANRPATGEPSASRTEANPGQQVVFSADDFRPGGAVSPVTYSWRFQQEGCGIACLGYTGGQLGAAYLPPVSGAVVTHTWREAGTYLVELTATDSEGREAVTSMSIRVGA